LRAHARTARLDLLDGNGKDVPFHEERFKEITTLFEAGVLLLSATLPMGTNTFASGK
jgi:hypothetical protein